MSVVLHVDDNEANRRIVRRMMAMAAYEVVEAQTGADGLRAAPSADLVILDIDLPDLGGLEVCRPCVCRSSRRPTSPSSGRRRTAWRWRPWSSASDRTSSSSTSSCPASTGSTWPRRSLAARRPMHDSDSYVLEAVRCGATGYIAKGAASTELVRAVRSAVAGRRYLRPAVPDSTIEQYLRRARGTQADLYDLLTRRERQVLHLVAEGLSRAAIAQRLGISPRTAEAHRASVMRRLGLKGRTELIRYALSRGLVPLDAIARPRDKGDRRRS